MSWDKVEIGKVCDVGRGSSPRPIDNSAYFIGGEIPWIKIADATASGKYIYKTKEVVNELGASYSRRLQPGSLIIATSGVSLGQIKFLGVEGCIHDGWLYVNNFRGVDKEFLYYHLLTMQEEFLGRAYGAAIQNINTTILRESKIHFPPLPTQRRIASTLSAYDDLIENNLKRIKLLEEKAKLHYKELMQESAKWDKVRLEDFVSVVKGRKPKNVLEQPEDDSQLYLLLDTVERTKTLYTSDLTLPLSKETDVLMCMDGARSGLAFRGMVGAIGSTMAIWRSNSERVSGEFLFQFMKQNESAITQGNTGAAIPHANRKFILDMKIAIPPKKEAVNFDKLTNPIIKLVNTLHNQNTKLREARDILLPRLMSGEMEV